MAMNRTTIRSCAIRTVVTLCGIAACATLSGCQNTGGGASLMSEGGVGASLDSHVYVSRSWQPWTVTVRDTRTGQAFWSIDVPVGKKLAIQFVRGSGTETQYTPDLMKWGLMEETAGFSNLTNSLPVPAQDSRRLEPTLRAVPELPPDMTGRAEVGTDVQVR